MNKQKLNFNSLDPYLAQDLLKKFNIVYGNITTPTIIYDEESLEILGANNSALRFFGLTRNEILKISKAKNFCPKKNNMISALPHITQYIDYINSWKHYDKNGNFFQMQILSHSLTLAERDVRVVLIKDVTSQSKMFEFFSSRIN